MNTDHDHANGPIFISGRQHSGNTVMAVIIGKINGVYAQVDESVLIEQHALVDRIRDPLKRAKRIFELMKLEATEHRPWLQTWLRDRVTEHPRDAALTMYLDAMDAVASRLGDRRWAQKGTSYIFYAREILTTIPNARMIYLVRNPWDLAASRKRRNPGSEPILSTMMGWNRGIRTAEDLHRRHPDRLLMVRYEDLVGQPRESVQRLCDWLGEPFSEALLDIPHVNPAENKYALESDVRGLNTSKTYRYPDRLGPAEIAAMDLLVARYQLEELIGHWYPDLPHRIGEADPLDVRRARRSLRTAPFRYGWMYLTRFPQRPGHLLSRTLRRIRGE